MRTALALIPLLAFAPPLLAQESRAASTPTSTPDQAYAALVKEYQAAFQAWSVQQRKTNEEAKKNGTPAPASMMVLAGGGTPQLAREFAPRFVEGAARYAGTDGAIPFHLWLLRNQPSQDQLARSLATLAQDHIGSARLQEVLQALQYGRVDGPLAETLDTLIEKSPHASVRAGALYLRGKGLGAKQAQAAKKDLTAAVEQAPESWGGTSSKGLLNELERLQVGMAAPEIEGADLDGVKFKLSDYRGKVVVLDFWGDW